MSDAVVVVGAGLAGLRTVEQLRRAGFEGTITLAGAESHMPYDRPPLTKQVLTGAKTAADVTLCDAESLRELDVELKLGSAAVRLDRAGRKVAFDDGAVLDYDRLVIATGITPIRLPLGSDLVGVHVLRTLEDVLGFRADLEGSAVLIVGAGFIGCEVAAGLREQGLDVVVVEGQSAPLAGSLGHEVGSLVARLHTEAGVDLRCGVTVAELLGQGRVREARLSDGSEVATRVVLSGIGSRPAVSWLDGSGLEIGNGIHCDENGRTSDPNVWAVGDVAAWFDPAADRHVRVEHWTGAGEQAAIVAKGICGDEIPGREVPYFWSDQYGLKIQALGHFGPDDEVQIVKDDGRRFVALYVRDGSLVGAVGCGRPRNVLKLRPLIAGAAPLGDALPIATA